MLHKKIMLSLFLGFGLAHFSCHASNTGFTATQAQLAEIQSRILEGSKTIVGLGACSAIVVGTFSGVAVVSLITAIGKLAGKRNNSK